MSLIKLPEIQARQSTQISFDPPHEALNHWQPDKTARAQAGETVLELYGIVGDDWCDKPVTAERVSAFLAERQDVTVSINSPGGSYFEGIGIYNLLRAHPHKITVQIIGDAASAASVIAMAGDEILIGDGAFVMIHNAWGAVWGNRHELAQSIDLLAQIDEAMASLYAARTGKDQADIAAMMDKETWLNADTALAEGFATAKLHDAPVSDPDNGGAERKAKAQIESALRAQGYSRSQARAIIQSYKHGTPRAAVPVMPRADTPDPEALQQLLDNLKG
ncbi:head maturation protease, ClpP-related [Conchiformibius kuhniae]|uniref:ATP-dependent Clp protease proteolytic subunit n=1 Tax=Conchiformibius kuhniae TaxID=211502 RepID=A0A8T9MVN7_9NEIS|nr:head maturation protease, ClpP-related [Conchiformibius kuhniae]UOP05329.1 Clp protease ClpP [Conchiformibius kuhniae]